MPLVQSDAALSDHARDYARQGCAGSDSADSAVTSLRDTINLRAHFRRGQESISAPIHWCAARMRCLPLKVDGMPLDAEGPQDCSQRKIQIEQDWTLFDM